MREHKSLKFIPDKVEYEINYTISKYNETDYEFIVTNKNPELVEHLKGDLSFLVASNKNLPFDRMSKVITGPILNNLTDVRNKLIYALIQQEHLILYGS